FLRRLIDYAKKQKEEDFYLLYCVAIDRMHPRNAGVFLWVTLLIGGIITLIITVAIYGSDYDLKPSWFYFANSSIVISLIHFLIFRFFTKTENFYRFQKTLAVILSIVTIKLSLDFYIGFIIFSEGEYLSSTFRRIALVSCIGGVIFMILSSIRGIIKVRQGAFRKGGTGLYNFKENITSPFNAPLILGILLISGSLLKTFNKINYNFTKTFKLVILLLVAILLQYALAMAIPEFFLIIYCKFRFKSFIITPPKPPLQEMPRDVILAKKKPIHAKASKTAKSKKHKG
ncbi:hypothetical protein A374_10465, partial [Fictibacillus macauensis ZFHKF-1]